MHNGAKRAGWNLRQIQAINRWSGYFQMPSVGSSGKLVFYLALKRF